VTAVLENPAPPAYADDRLDGSADDKPNQRVSYFTCLVFFDVSWFWFSVN
jgi:hypothetical protein